MSKTKRKTIIDDGMNPDLVAGADFDGYFGIPIIKRPKEFIIPSGITPFSKRLRITDTNEAIGFHEMDKDFAEALIHPDSFLEALNTNILISPEKELPIISPDCSLYRDAPLAVQVSNVYRNRALGFHWQKRGMYVIPQVRWGNDLTYTTKILPEKIAFLGIEKHSIVAIGSYGCIKSRENKYHFKAGLSSMMETLEPAIVLVYGSMPDKVFNEFLKYSHFIQYPNWTARKKRGGGQ